MISFNFINGLGLLFDWFISSKKLGFVLSFRWFEFLFDFSTLFCK